MTPIEIMVFSLGIFLAGFFVGWIYYRKMSGAVIRNAV